MVVTGAGAEVSGAGTEVVGGGMVPTVVVPGGGAPEPEPIAVVIVPDSM